MKILDPEEYFKEWQRIVENDSRYCFYNTIQWYQLQEKYYNIQLKFFNLNINGEFILIPVFERKRKFGFREYNTSLLGTYGTILIDKNQDLEEESVLSSIDKKKNFNISGNPFFSENFSDNNSNDFTQILYLENLTTDHFKGNHRRFIIKAEKDDMNVISTEDLSEWKLYFEIYTKVKLERGDKSSNDYNYKLFELIYNLPVKMRKLWIVKHDNKIVGGGVFFYYKNKVHHWHGAFMRDKLKFGSTYLMHSIVMKDAQEKGFNIYDFNPSGGHKGVEKFKSGFNPEKLYFLRAENQKLIYGLALKSYEKIRMFFKL
ncbi:GNAT family N-acetyltransferase [Portibacter lacus]|uniref:BioF2-like acetyltransferase domain-containing protein n=1 Tax=Portibacter lacus TaxID=1099794 RepID=A0AA37STH9_9BACT|nr:GNAT family N-acetyltransferase [Portibacter lacus]GLR19015.1 hypothetical protein GCM10007940_36310 [Portibacter lacus]